MIAWHKPTRIVHFLGRLLPDVAQTVAKVTSTRNLFHGKPTVRKSC